jgi:hypothetical protein
VYSGLLNCLRPNASITNNLSDLVEVVIFKLFDIDDLEYDDKNFELVMIKFNEQKKFGNFINNKLMKSPVVIVLIFFAVLKVLKFSYNNVSD